MAEPSEDWGTIGPVDRPITFHFEATEVLTVDDAHLKEWEEFTAERIGMRFEPLRAPSH